MNFDRDEVRALALGKFIARKCPCCDNDGRVWYDGATGLGVGPSPPVGVSKDDIADEPCENCDGIGFTISFID